MALAPGRHAHIESGLLLFALEGSVASVPTHATRKPTLTDHSPLIVSSPAPAIHVHRCSLPEMLAALAEVEQGQVGRKGYILISGQANVCPPRPHGIGEGTRPNASLPARASPCLSCDGSRSGAHAEQGARVVDSNRVGQSEVTVSDDEHY